MHVDYIVSLILNKTLQTARNCLYSDELVIGISLPVYRDRVTERYDEAT